MILKFALTLAVLLIGAIAALLALAVMRPDTFRVARQMNIEAPPERLFALISNFHNWGAWSPWEKMDPAMTRTFSGALNGKGSVYAWSGNDKVGQGRMEILETLEPSRITIKLDFVKPFEAHNIVEFTLEPSGASTNVTWAMEGPSPFIAKVMDVVFGMDKMVGQDFETGLANLKAAAAG